MTTVKCHFLNQYAIFQVDFNDIRARNIAERRREEEQKRKEEQQQKERIDTVVKELTGAYSVSQFEKFNLSIFS